MKDLRVLIIMEDQDEALEIEAKLISLGYDAFVVTAKDKLEVKIEEINPYLVLFELRSNTTKVDGVVTAEQIRARIKVPVIYLISDEKVMEWMGIIEPYEYILKPYTKRELQLVIKTAVQMENLKAKIVKDRMGLTGNELKTLAQQRVTQNTGSVKAWEDIFMEPTFESALETHGSAIERKKGWLRAILELLPVYIILLTPDYRVPFVNRFFRERFGDPQGQRCYKYLFGRDKPCENCESITVLQIMKPVEWEWKGPDDRDYYIYNFPFVDTNGSTIIMEIGIDITEHKLAEKTFQKASAYNRNLIEASLDPLVTIGPGGTITDVNSATEFVTGYSREELIGTDFSDYFTAPDLARAGYQKAFQEGSVRDYALEIRHRDGHITPVLYNASVYRDDAGNVTGVFAVARDISKLKQAETELQKHWELLQVTLDSLGEGVIAADQEGRIMLINQSAANLTGYSQTEAIGIII